ncbi:hypothetical protein Aperf_G00000066422 [Anoplocephala perfoliata]
MDDFPVTKNPTYAPYLSTVQGWLHLFTCYALPFNVEPVKQQQYLGNFYLAERQDYEIKTVPQIEVVVSETESEASGSFSSVPMLSSSSPHSSPSSCACDLRIAKNKSDVLVVDKKLSGEENCASKIDRNYEEREIRRKQRNNEASRKSRALRKRRFQQMLHETERLTNSNAKLRAFVEELNSIMAESRAILFETFAGSVTPDMTAIAHQQIQKQQQINHVRE